MSTSPTDAPIIGTDDNDRITVQNDVSFYWVPSGQYSYDAGDGFNNPIQLSGPGQGSGYISFNGVAPSEAFTSNPTRFSFRFSTGSEVDLSGLPFYGYTPTVAYDPATGFLDPEGLSIAWDDVISYTFDANQTSFMSAHDGEYTNAIEHGSWQLVPDIHNVDVFGGAGNDIILGGQGQETLDGGTGNDVIRASTGTDLLLGDAGDDELHAGIGNQILIGGTGNDMIWGGTGRQLLLGEDGQDVIHGGSGAQTLVGGAGNDILWGGSGVQFLQGWDGNDILHAGSGDEKLSGGAGRDTFVFSGTAGHDIITDFREGQDIITVASDFDGLRLSQTRDLLSCIAADTHGDATLTIGGNFRLVLQNVTARQVETHLSDFFKLS